MANRYPNFDILRSSTHPSTTVADSYNIESNYQKNIQLYDSQTNIIQQPSGNGFVCVGNVNLPNSNPIIDDSAEKIKQDELIYKMIDYLKNREIYDCTLLLLFPKAAFKSYTTNKEEKRYFSPKPKLDLIGNGWNNFFPKFQQLFSMNPEAATLLQEFNATSEIQYLETSNEIKSTKLQSIKQNSEILLSNSFNISCSKQNQIFLNFNTFFGEHKFGSLKSRTITLISKSSKSTSLCDESSPNYPRNFKNGDKIALFNRQATVTSCLTTENQSLSADSNQWSIFEIYKVNETNPFDEDGNIIYEQFAQLTYESTVILVDIFTKICSPLLKIKTTQTQFTKIKDHNKIPVSELQLCIFECLGFNGSDKSAYMTLSDPTKPILEFQTSTSCELPKFQWHIVSADFIKQQFYPIKELRDAFCIKQFPHIFDFFSKQFHSKWFFKFMGENFSSEMKVWIGSFECQIKAICSNNIEFYLPTLEEYKNHCQIYGIACSIQESAPIMLINEDGILFHTFFSYLFTGNEELFDCGQVSQI